MNPLEVKLISALETGQELSLADLGGVEVLASIAQSLGPSPVMPELLLPMLRHWQQASLTDRIALKRALQDLLEAASIDFVLMEAIDVLDVNGPLPDEADEACFTIFLTKAGQAENRMSGLARGAALDGAFRWATRNRRWQLRLLDFLLGLSAVDDPEFLTHAAKIIGVAYSHWREQDLLQVLTKLVDVVAAKGEATFELGMANLADALDAPHREGAHTSFQVAKDWFEHSLSTSESRPEASLYLDCLKLLTDYHSGFERRHLADIRDRVCVHAFELKAWHANPNSPSWLGLRRTEAACWNVLSSMLTGLVGHLDEASWWEPGVVIEQHVLAAYSAGRSVLRRNLNGSLDSLLRPRIAATIANREGQAYQLKGWLQRNASHEWADQAHELISQIDQLMDKGSKPENPIEAAFIWPPVAALIAQPKLSPETKRRLFETVSNAFSLHLDNFTIAEINVIETCQKSVENHPDYRQNPHGARLFDAALLWTVRFLYNRLEVTKKDDPSVGYLFERVDGKLPHEDELQQDYFRWISTVVAGSDLEPTNQGGGRADLRLKSSGERFVIEVKRETRDCSFDALAKSYSAQTTDYQNVSIRLGILLVLDLATSNREGTPHITSLVQPRSVQRIGEDQPRHIIIVKVPGQRKCPSDLSKFAKLSKC
jgi:hypothetical protein